MYKFLYNYLRNIKNKLKAYFFLRKYRKDTPQDCQKFYNRMRYLYIKEFKKRENFNLNLEDIGCIKSLNKNGFLKINLNNVSNKKDFLNTIIKFREKFEYIRKNFNHEYSNHANHVNYLLNYNFEFNKDVKTIADPFVDIATKYLGTLPILDSFKLWYSPNDSNKLIGSQLLHRDPEDYKQLKIFIPIDEIQIENGPLNVINKDESKKLYEYLVSNNLTKTRNQKIDDKYVGALNITKNQLTLNNNECALVDTCACYHFGSRKSSKPRKLLFLHFTTAFSAKTPIFRNYDIEKKFVLEKDRLVYGLQKQNINHYKKRQYLTI